MTRTSSARTLSPRRRAAFEPQLRLLVGNQVFLAAVTVMELRYGALVAQWGASRRAGLEAAIAAVTVVPVTDPLLSRAAELRHSCRQAGHPPADRSHANDLWIAASAMRLDVPLLTRTVYSRRCRDYTS
ncbi:MAG TPA: PIN domain-containing protein [Acidimicrobiales bacterium]|nr:PIN domain-containing protein [Acidimicrobiales bacterium]